MKRQHTRTAPLRRPLAGALLLALAAGAAAQDASDEQIKALDRVKVTAQSREQELKDVPIAIQVVDAAAIERLAATDIGDLDSFLPGLEVSDGSPTQPRYSIRGISTGDFGVGTDPAVGVYIDGVYAARSGGALMAFNDVERIEVLKGPQGTLFGRNTSAGAISIVTKRPGREHEGRASLRIGDDGQRYVYGLYNLPITDSSAVRMSFVSNESDGWLQDAATGQDYAGQSNWASKIAWRTRFASGTVLDVSWDHEETEQLARPAIGLVALPPYPYPAAFPADPGDYLDPFKAPVYNDVVGNREARRFDGATLQLYHGFEWASVTYSAAFRSFNTINREDEDGTNRINLYFDTANIEDNASTYHELKFNGVSGPVDWVAGVSRYDEDARQTSQTNTFTDSIDTIYYNMVGFPLFSVLQQAMADNGVPGSVLGLGWSEPMHNTGRFSASAVFGDAIWHVNDRLNLTAGLRYTRDSKDFTWLNGPREAADLDATLAFLDSPLAQGFLSQFYQYLASIDPMLPYLYTSDVVFNYAGTGVEGVKVRAKNRWTDVSPRFVADYRLNDRMMVWGSYTEGYKAGGYNSVQINSRFDNEDVTNLEVGLKGETADGRLGYSTSVFRYVYNDRQSLRLDLNNSSGIPQYLVDTSDEEALGWDLQASWRPLDALRLNFSSQYIDQTYKHYVNSDGDDLSGQATGLPKWSFALGGDYVIELGDGGRLEFSVNHAYRGKTRCNDDSQAQGNCQLSPNFALGVARERTDARIQYSAAGGRWGVGAYVQNLMDNRYVEGVNNLTTDVLGTPFASISEPRHYGMEFRVAF